MFLAMMQNDELFGETKTRRPLILPAHPEKVHVPR
jgi:hypothetical protein